jgi:steroid 5-alpha reductase family enzyme
MKKHNSTIGRPGSIALSLFIYVIATAVAIFAGRLFTMDQQLVVIAAGDLAATFAVFIFSVILNNSSAYDPYWSVKPFVIAVAYIFMFEADELSLRQLLVLTGITLYALRLTLNFYRDWPGFVHEDWRYVNFRVKFGKAYWLISFLGIHLFPTIMVYLGCLALLPVFEDRGAAFNAWDIAGAVVLFGSVALAFTADEQLRIFRKKPGNRGKTIRTGLWGASRHPNYLGEILTWWGLFLFAMAVDTRYWWTIAGPLSITVMFLFASIPMIEKRHLEKRTDYFDYKKSTPMLLPLRFGKK